MRRFSRKSSLVHPINESDISSITSLSEVNHQPISTTKKQNKTLDDVIDSHPFSPSGDISQEVDTTQQESAPTLKQTVSTDNIQLLKKTQTRRTSIINVANSKPEGRNRISHQRTASITFLQDDTFQNGSSVKRQQGNLDTAPTHQRDLNQKCSSWQVMLKSDQRQFLEFKSNPDTVRTKLDEVQARRSRYFAVYLAKLRHDKVMPSLKNSRFFSLFFDRCIYF